MGTDVGLIALSSAALRCTIDPLGAELASLSGADGREWLWNGDARWWGGRAPVLFPIIGMLAGGKYRWQGRDYALDKHGFARRRRFEVVSRDDASATLRLVADAATRKIYPFEFALELRFALGDALVIAALVRNAGEGPMPFNFGFHPALRWERGGAATIRFAERETGGVSRIDGDGLIDRCEDLPGDGRVLALDDALFAADAMILRGVASRSLLFGSSGGRVTAEWDNLPDLALWTKPGAPFLCIEPWAGFNDPAGFDGELDDKPGIVMLAPAEEWAASMTIKVG
jgi:galactose mutarotase-like enzyme